MTPSRLTARGLIGAAAALAAASLIATPVAAAPNPTAAVVDASGDAFVRNNVVQAGAKPNGTFGSSTAVADTAAAAAGFTAINGSGALGLINDPTGDGFGVGVDHGDFFLPGSPYEAWGIYVGGQLLRNTDDSTEIEGAFAPVADGVSDAVTWSTTSPANGIEIEQTYSAPADQQHFITIDVELTNTTGASQTVYYIRQVDPDNSVDKGGDYDTFNTVLAQSSTVQLVTGYSYDDNSVIGYQAADPNAVVRIADWVFPFLEYDEATESEVVVAAGDAAAVFAQYRSDFKVGYRDFLDSTIDIVVKREIAAGATATLTFDYVLDRSALSTPHPDTALELSLEMEIGAPYADVPAALAGGGLKPSSEYTLTEFSTPRVIFSGTTLENGNFYDTTALPTDCRPGSHTLVLEGTAPDGSTVSDKVTYTVDDDCIVVAFDPYAAVNGAPEEGPTLANTGSDPVVALTMAGVALLLGAAGAAVLIVARRRGAGAL